MARLFDDFRLAARRLRQRPGFTAVAVLTLALGLGANIAIFTLVHATMFQTLPVASPHELVRLGDNDNCCVNSGLQTEVSLFSYTSYSNLRDNLPQLASLAAFQASPQQVGIRRVGTLVSDTMPSAFVSANYFATFGVRPAAGRVLEPDDDRAGAEPVFVISHTEWDRRFGSDPSVNGAAFLVAGKPMTLVGVAAADFFGETVRPDPAGFETMGTRLLRGRTIGERDGLNAPRVAVVNEAFVRRFFPNTDPVGHRLGIGGTEHAGDFEIVGVSEDVKYTSAQQPTRPMIFFPTIQMPPFEDATARSVQPRSMSIGAVELHVASNIGSIEPLLRQAVAEVDPDMAVVRVLPMAVQVGLNFQVNRLMARLTAAYGLLALAVAALGLYGVTSYGVARRTREIGVRMALGAGRTRVLIEIVRGALAQTGIGLLIGLPVAALATATLASLLYGVQPRDPVVFAKAALVLAASAVVAAILPARRAASIDPAHALRSE